MSDKEKADLASAALISFMITLGIILGFFLGSYK